MPSLAALFAVTLLPGTLLPGTLLPGTLLPSTLVVGSPSPRHPRLEVLQLELEELEATLPAERDDTLPTVMIGVGAAGLAVGALGAIVGFTTAPCTNFAPSGYPYGRYAGGFGVAGGCVEHRTDWGLIGPMIALASIGAITLVVGVVQLVQSGAPYRRRDRLRRRIERMERSIALDVSVAPQQATVSVSGTF